MLFVGPAVPTFDMQIATNPHASDHHCKYTPVHLLCYMYRNSKQLESRFFRCITKTVAVTYNIIVGYARILKCWAACVKREQSILPTRIFVLISVCATCPQIGSVRLQCPHDGA